MLLDHCCFGSLILEGEEERHRRCGRVFSKGAETGEKDHMMDWSVYSRAREKKRRTCDLDDAHFGEFRSRPTGGGATCRESADVLGSPAARKRADMCNLS